MRSKTGAEFEEIGNATYESNTIEHSRMGQDPFLPINSRHLHTITEILKFRLPRSAHIYNMAILAIQFSDIKIYTLQGDLSENAVIVIIYFRKDFGQEANISVPLNFDYKSSDNVKQAFINSSIIDWDEIYTFFALDRLISPMIAEISIFHKGNSTLINPVFYYYMSQEDAAALEIKTDSGVEVKSLDTEQGLEFLVKGWKWSRPGTEEYTKLVIEKGITSGLYLNGKPVCGLIANVGGSLGMLYTGKNYRGQGYAITCSHYLLKQMAAKGLVGASALECKNIASLKFHDKIGMTLTHFAEDILFAKPGFESK